MNAPLVPTVNVLIKGEDLQVYAKQLMMEGFRIMVPQPQLTVHGMVIPVDWFVYARDGLAGIVETKLDGWEHLMPVRPTRENGSAILIFDPKWQLRVGDAVVTAQLRNRGVYNGNREFQNAGSGSDRWQHYLSLERAV